MFEIFDELGKMGNDPTPDHLDPTPDHLDLNRF